MSAANEHPASAPPSDAELLMLEARLIEEEARYRRFDMSNEPRSLAEKANEATEATERQLIDTPAQGMKGVAVKLRRALKCMNPDPRDVPFNDLDWGPQILIRVYEDIARLVPKPDADEKLLALEARWAESRRERHAAAEGSPEEADEGQREDEAELQILEIPARGPTGIAAKLRVWWYYHQIHSGIVDDKMNADSLNYYDRFAIAALCDAENLAGTAQTFKAPCASVVDLETEMIRHRDKVNSDDTPDTDKADHSNKFFDLLGRIKEAPAKTLSDLAARLRTLEHVLKEWGGDFDGYQDFAQSVREDAERLAEGRKS